MMKQVHALLCEDRGQAARACLSEMIAQNSAGIPLAADIIANILWTAYEQFHVQAIHDFCADMELDLPATITERIQQALDGKIQRTREWTKTLRKVTQERLARECRKLIVANDVKGAAARAVTLLGRARDEAETDNYCALLARALAELTHDHERALAVVGAVMKTGGQIGAAGGLLAGHFSTMSREFKTLQFEIGDQGWLREQIEAVLSLRGFLPGPNEAGEPDQVQLDKFYDEIHAIARAGLGQRNREDFIDAMQILLEYCPADDSRIKNVAGVEDRMFTNLGPRAKLTTVRALGRLGEIEPLRRGVLSLARDSEKEDRLKLVTAIMGGLRHADFFPYLKHMLARAGTERDEELIDEALGRIGNPEAVDLLLDRFHHAVKRRREPAHERRAFTMLTAFGRIGRAKGFDPAARNQLIRKLIKNVEGAERQLTFRVALEMFSVRMQELESELKAWAAEQAVEAMWGQPPDARAAVAALNSWREPMVIVLKRLGNGALDAVLAAAARHATRYSGALSALANALAEIGDERAVDILGNMTRLAFLHQDDPKRSKLFEEKVVDAATGELHDLNRDDLLNTLLFTMVKVGGAEGTRVAMEYANDLQAGRLESPGPQTIAFLVDLKLRHGQLKLNTATPQAAAADMKIDEKELRSTMAEARGGLLTKKAIRIAAMVRLAQWRRLESVGVLRDALGDKDPLVASAAHGALARFMQPLPDERGFTEFLDSLFDRPGSLKGRTLEHLLDFIRREMPKNPPYDRLFQRQVAVAIEDEMMAHQLRGAIVRSEQPPPADKSQPAAPEKGAEGKPEAAFTDDRISRSVGSGMTELDKRRAFMQARREWLAGGKVGEPPRPPT